MSSLPDTVHVVGPTQLSVVVVLGESRVSVVMPVPAGMAQLSEAQARATALRHARRALTVAEEELEAADVTA